MSPIYLVSVGGARISPASIDAVWVFTAGDVFVNVRAGGMTFKETFVVERTDDGETTDAAYKNAHRAAENLVSDVTGVMYLALNRDDG